MGAGTPIQKEANPIQNFKPPTGSGIRMLPLLLDDGQSENKLSDKRHLDEDITPDDRPSAVLLIMIAFPALADEGASGLYVPGIFGLLSLIPTVIVYIKRFHDRDKSGWWVLIGLIPIIGAIWLLVELGFLAGTPGPNGFGPPVTDLVSPSDQT